MDQATAQQNIMQPQYLQDASKTSRTLGMQEEIAEASRIKAAKQMANYNNNSVIRKPPRIHRRNKGKKIPYY